MKKLIIYLIMVVTCFTLQGQDKTLPNIIIKDLDGNNVNIQDIENDSNPIILNFWATWCKPCKNELNNIDDLYQEWKEETNVKIIIVSVDDSRSSAKVKPYINSMGWTFEALSDPNRQLARQLNVITVPHTFLINGEGKIVYEHKGYITGDEDELYEQLKLIK
jgi:peroxiredoxin